MKQRLVERINQYLIYNGSIITKKYDGSMSIRDFVKENYSNIHHEIDAFAYMEEARKKMISSLEQELLNEELQKLTKDGTLL